MEKKYKVTVFKDRTEWRNLEGKFHREDGPAIEYINGDKAWCIDGNQHREDGPAVEHANGYKAWYIDGLRHREDGPAVEYINGDKAWYIYGENLTKQEFNNRKTTLTISEIEKRLGITNLEIVK